MVLLKKIGLSDFSFGDPRPAPKTGAHYNPSRPFERPNPQNFIKYYELGIQQFTELDGELALVLKESYQGSRKNIIQIQGQDFFYVPHKSFSLYAHYENADNIVIAFHGANEQNLMKYSVGQYFGGSDIVNQLIAVNQEGFLTNKKKILSLKKTFKNVILVGHSFGFLSICKTILDTSLRFDRVFIIVGFGGFVPSYLARDVARLQTRKHFYYNDWSANTILGLDDINSLIYLPKNPSPQYIESHRLTNFLRPIQELNSDLL